MRRFQEYVAATGKALDGSSPALSRQPSAQRARRTPTMSAGLLSMGSPLPEVPARAPTSAEVKSYVRATVDNARRQLEAMLSEVEAAAPPAAAEEEDAPAAAAGADGRPASAAAGKPGAGADTLERPADEGTFLLHAAVGVLDFLQHRLTAGRKGFPRNISLAGRGGAVEETPKTTARGSRGAKPVTLPPIAKRKAAAAPLPVVASMSDPAAAVFQGHGREAEALATLPAEPPLVSQPSAAARVGAEMEMRRSGLMGALRGDVRPWGKKTANVPLR